jgi:hypothetical protein
MFRYTGNGRGNGGDVAAEPVPVESRAVSADLTTRPSLQVLGEVSSGGYVAIIQIFQARFEELRAAGDWRVRRLTSDTFRRFGPVTLAPILGVLGLKIIAVEDPEQMERMRPRWTRAKFRRWSTYASGGMLTRKRPRKSYSFARDPEMARAARAARTEQMTPAARSRLARRAAIARWAKVREAARKATATRVAA